MNLKEKIKKILEECFNGEISYASIVIENPKDRKMGDYALPCFSYSKVLHKAPNIIAEEVKNYLEQNCSFLNKVEVIGGYVNVFLDKLVIA